MRKQDENALKISRRFSQLYQRVWKRWHILLKQKGEIHKWKLWSEMLWSLGEICQHWSHAQRFGHGKRWMEKTDEQKSTALSSKLAKQKDTKNSRQAFKIAFK